MICSFLTPSRCRLDRLVESIDSINASEDPRLFEIAVRLDENDPTLMEALKRLANYRNVRTLVGPRMKGYASMNAFYASLAVTSKADWVWIWNDDCLLKGQGWADQLWNSRRDNIIFQPETYALGSSEYYNSEATAFPIVPNGSWGDETIQDPADTWLNEHARMNKWEVRFLSGITVNHQRDLQPILEEHRKL